MEIGGRFHLIRVGSTIFFELNDDGEEKHRYRSKILDFDDNKIYVDFPVDDETKKRTIFMVGTQFRAWFLGEDEAIYLLTTELLDKMARDNIPMLVFNNPGEENFIRVQRRQYVRVDVAVDVAVHPMNASFQPFTTVTADLSAGGMALVLQENHPLREGEEINVWLSLLYRSGEIIYINTKAKAIRFIDDKGILKGSFQFIDINEGDRQKIIRFCFEKQLEYRKKEKNIKK